MILVIDNYDSFVYNLVHYIEDFGVRAGVHRNDALSVSEALKLNPRAVVLSPGPCTPNEAGICLELFDRAPADLPIFGVCLGHQAMGQAYGGHVVRAKTLMHGKTSQIFHDDQGLFRGVPQGFPATRYHSLMVTQIPTSLTISAETKDGIVMGLRHRDFPTEGIQFHPESIMTVVGKNILKNFLKS